MLRKKWVYFQTKAQKSAEVHYFYLRKFGDLYEREGDQCHIPETPGQSGRDSIIMHCMRMTVLKQVLQRIFGELFISEGCQKETQHLNVPLGMLQLS